jgi:nucleotide-binding universal stress UspA family protein
MVRTPMGPVAKQKSGRSLVGLHSVLVPVDLTALADRVLGRVSLLPLADQARVTLLHVIPESLPASEQRKAARDADKALAGAAKHLRKQIHGSVTIAWSVKIGAAAKEIARSATLVHAELIVLGRGGGRAVRDAFLGATAERVVRHSQRPVLVVRLTAREVYRRPALALDLDRTAVDVVRLAVRVLPSRPPRVDVVHAFQIPYQGMVYPSLSGDEAEERKEELRIEATHTLRQLLGDALLKANVGPGEGPSFRNHVQHGPPRLVVEKAIKRADTDLLVLGTRGHSGLTYVFLGTVAGELLRAARCDVLVVPPRRAQK